MLDHRRRNEHRPPCPSDTPAEQGVLTEPQPPGLPVWPEPQEVRAIPDEASGPFVCGPAVQHIARGVQPILSLGPDGAFERTWRVCRSCQALHEVRVAIDLGHGLSQPTSRRNAVAVSEREHLAPRHRHSHRAGRDRTDALGQLDHTSRQTTLDRQAHLLSRSVIRGIVDYDDVEVGPGLPLEGPEQISQQRASIADRDDHRHARTRHGRISSIGQRARRRNGPVGQRPRTRPDDRSRRRARPVWREREHSRRS